MKILSKLTFCVFALLLLSPGCTDGDSAAPPVLSIMDDMEALNKAKQEQALQKIREQAAAEAAANPPQSTEQMLPSDVSATGKFTVQFETSAGTFVVEVDRSWAPIGADRFYKLVKDGFYNGAGFFRVAPDFMVQWGLAADPQKTAKWDKQIIDDKVIKSNTRGYITFAKTGAPNSRTGQIFINYGDNSRLDGQGFAPFGKVVSGMDVVSKINPEYGESPDQGQITRRGNEYLMAEYPRLSYIKTATITSDDQAMAAAPEAEPVTSETEQ